MENLNEVVYSNSIEQDVIIANEFVQRNNVDLDEKVNCIGGVLNFAEWVVSEYHLDHVDDKTMFEYLEEFDELVSDQQQFL